MVGRTTRAMPCVEPIDVRVGRPTAGDDEVMEWRSWPETGSARDVGAAESWTAAAGLAGANESALAERCMARMGDALPRMGEAFPRMGEAPAAAGDGTVVDVVVVVVMGVAEPVDVVDWAAGGDAAGLPTRWLCAAPICVVYGL